MDEQIEGLALRVDENEMNSAGLDDRLREVESGHETNIAALEELEASIEELSKKIEGVLHETMMANHEFEARILQLENILHVFSAISRQNRETA